MKKIISLILILTAVMIASSKCFATGFGIGKTKPGERPYVPYQELFQKYDSIYIGPDEKKVYLTFDCGYENGYTSTILNILQEEDVKASFFITGHYLNSATDLVKRMDEEGHLVCNHTVKHKSFAEESNESILEDVSGLESLYQEKIGKSLVKIVRPPKGEFSEQSLSFLSSKGYKEVFWSLAYQDWNSKIKHGNHYSYNQVISRIHNGAIILMHCVSYDNKEDLKDILIEIKNQGYSFGLVNQI